MDNVDYLNASYLPSPLAAWQQLKFSHGVECISLISQLLNW